ncbi:unnamed protein product [Ranitomeya imitator]|uniref:Integrase catalytic domain-containing protein n=1 Tax=Ranitomeya imitator TaxID=111125 RepID=A0ABN9MDL8_9NEOB|nr:unnamed protein product [Ranitomeya imitator]
MNDLIGAYWFAPGISTLTAKFTSSCLTCGKCNPWKNEESSHTSSCQPAVPLQRIQIDHIQMPPSGGFEYALVVVDVFSGWPEVFPSEEPVSKDYCKETTLKR